MLNPDDVRRFTEELPTIDGKSRDLAALVEACSTVVTADGYEMAGHCINDIAEFRKAVIEHFEPMISGAFKIHRAYTGRRQHVLGTLDGYRARVQQAMMRWSAEQERLKRQREVQLQQAAQRLEDEAVKEDAKELRKAGYKDEAKELRREGRQAPAVVLESPVPKVKGVTTVTVWKYRITDVGLIPRQYLEPSHQAIRSVVQALKDKANIPGVEAYPEESVRVTGRRD
jgi:hypothetical protein